MLCYELEDGLYTAGPYFFAKVTDGSGPSVSGCTRLGRGRRNCSTLYRNYQEAFC